MSTQTPMTLERAVAVVNDMFPARDRAGLVDRDSEQAEAVLYLCRTLAVRGRALDAIQRECLTYTEIVSTPESDLRGHVIAIVRLALDDDEIAPQACRRCSDCEGQEHHWQDGVFNDDLDYQCKHCPATAPACAGCGSIILPQCTNPDCGEPLEDDE